MGQTITLRDYQEKGVQKCLDFLKKPNPKPSLLVHCTGTGKSIVIGKLVSLIKDPVLIIQPSVEILKQNYAKFTLYGGKGSLYSHSVKKKEIGRVTYATLASIKAHALDFKKIGVKIVIIDEADFQIPPEPSSMYSKFMKVLKPTHILGFTATPFRLEQFYDQTSYWSQLNMLTRSNPKIFHNYLDVIQIQDMVDKKYWATIDYEEWDFDESLLKLNTNGSEYTNDTILKNNKEQNINNKIYQRCLMLLQNKESCIVFMDSVENAQKMAELLGDKAECVSTHTKADDRTQIIDDFKKGKLQILTNHSTLGIGFDYPELKTVILGRPTNSLARIYQWVGRVCRNPIYPKQKKSLVIDFCNNIKRFGKIENLVIKEVEGYGWGVFSGKYILTGVPMDAKITIDEILDDTENNPDFILTFGKFAGSKLHEIPQGYREWLLTNIHDFKYLAPKDKALIRSTLIHLRNKKNSIPKDESKLILVDINTILAKFAKKNVNSVISYLEYIQKLCKTSNMMLIVDDFKKNYWRKKIFPEYKENRKKLQLKKNQVKVMNDVYSTLPIIKQHSLEADDIITNTIHEDKCMQYYIVSTDSDFEQLAFFKKVWLLNPNTLKWSHPNKQTALQTLIKKILKGDRKDNVPKSHTGKMVKTKILTETSKAIFKDVVSIVKEKNITKVEDIPLKDIFWRHLNENFEMDKKLFEMNFKLLNLIQIQKP